MSTNNFSKKIVIADSQFLVVETLKTLLGIDERFIVADVVSSQSELLKVLDNGFYDLLITDFSLIDYDSIDDLLKIKQKFQPISILILTNSISKTEFAELSKIGVKNIIYKTADRDEILSAVDAAFKGKKYYAEEILDMILEQGDNKSVPDEPTHLTSSEIEIVRLIAGGLTTKEIASQKNISFHTVNTHRKNIFRKMGVSNASELIMHAIKAGWIDNIEYFI
ncbi:MAG: response regulator transcription factor [Prolixibacteraceae bacterium]|nr:response regulator transcription factor [Prolixibacteraceae bacterium]